MIRLPFEVHKALTLLVHAHRLNARRVVEDNWYGLLSLNKHAFGQAVGFATK